MPQKKNKKKKPAKPGRNTVQRQQPELFSEQFHTTTSFYKKNMAALREHYPELAQQVARCPFTGRYRVQASERRDSTPNLYCAEGDFYYYDNRDPLEDAKQQLESLNLHNAKLAICLGAGLGYELVYFVNHILANASTQALIIIEKDLELFKLLCAYCDVSGLLSNPAIFFLIGSEQEKLYVPLRNIIKKRQWYLILRTLKPFYHMSSLHLAKDYYLNALREVTVAASHSVSEFGNCPEDSLIGVENMLANLSVIIRNPGINQLYGAFKGKPAIVASTGPSLDKNKHLLKGLEDKALLICPDASLPILLEMGVKPHLVTSLERVIQVTRYFQDIPAEQISDSYLAACPVIRKESYDLYRGPKVIVYRNLDHFKWLGVERGILDIKASAGNMAFKIAAALGCDPIILVGQDLAFDRSGITHAAGHAYGEKQEGFYAAGLLTVPGNDGQPIQTNTTLFGFLKDYEIDVAEYTGTCVNATEGGAFIQGTAVMTLAEAIRNYLAKDIEPLRTMRQYLAPADDAAAKETAAQVMANMETTAGELAKIRQTCKEGLAYLQEAAPGLKDATQAQAQNVLSEVIAYKKRCMADYHTYQLFFTHVIQSFSIKFEMTVHAIPDTHRQPAAAIAETALYHQEWFATISRLAAVCEETLHKYRDLLYFDFN